MHEMSIAIELYRGLRSEIQSRGGGRLRRATVVVGELSAIEPDLLRFAWESVIAQGPDGGALLEIEWRAVEQTCPHCGPVAATTPGGWLRLCPNCDVPLLLEGGRELDIASLTYDESETRMTGSLGALESLESKP
ncbi:MAG: hydrogenase maturation nickel metallochaperone HypA [Planctomycetes bacterium]|nr:hydrogenase maturation nickel metallochaperone HypA [Planctomycetota bacterium]